MSASKVRTQIQLEPRQYERVKRLAAERGVSMSALIRSLMDEALGDAPGADRTRSARLAFVGSGKDVEGRRDVAREHDRYLYGGE